jgi:hypothetical protein
MNYTVPATNIGSKDNGCIVVTLLSPLAQRQISNLLSELSGELGEAIWPMPASSLHSTLCEIIQPKPYTEDKATLYRDNHTAYEAALQQTLSHYGPIPVTFNRIEASPHAIVVFGDDGGVFNTIRAELLKTLPFPAETKLPPDAVHCSIARYTQEIDLLRAQDVVARHSISFEEIVSEFQFVYPAWPHMLQFDVVRRYPLAH